MAAAAKLVGGAVEASLVLENSLLKRAERPRSGKPVLMGTKL